MKDKSNHHGAVGKSSLEQHFHKSAAITLLCKISGALQLAQPGLMAGRQTKYRGILKFSKLAVGQNI